MLRLRTLILAGLTALGLGNLACADIPQNLRVQVALTPSGQVNLAFADGNDGAVLTPLTWDNTAIASAKCTAGSGSSVNILSALTKPMSGVTTVTLLQDAGLTGVTFDGTSLVCSGSTVASTGVYRFKASYAGSADALSLGTTLSIVAAVGSDTLAPPAPKGLTVAAGPGTNVLAFDASGDMHDGAKPGSGIDHYEVLDGGSHLANVAAPAGISVPFSTVTLGSFSPTPTASQSGTSITETAAGTGFHATATEQGILSKATVSGDFTLSGKIPTFASAADQYATFGFRIEASPAAVGAPFFFCYQQPSLMHRGLQCKARTVQGGLSANVATYAGLDAPNCIKVTSVANLLSFFYATDASCLTWQAGATQSMALGTSKDVSVALSSQAAGVTDTATMSDIVLTASPALSYTHTTTGAHTYTVKAYDIAGNASAASGAVTSTAGAGSTAPRVKWHPGQYLLLTAHNTYSPSYISALSSEPYIIGVEQIFDWSAIETARGTYNFTTLDALRNACAAVGKRFVPQIWFTSFAGNKTTHLPQYLATEANGDGGWFIKTDVNGNPIGVIAKVWNPVIAARLTLLQAAVAAHFDTDPYYEGLSMGESDLGIGSPKDADTKNAWAAQLRNIAVGTVAASPHSNVWAQTNFLGAGHQAQADLIAFYSANRVGFSSPDSMIQNATVDWGTSLVRGLTWDPTACAAGKTPPCTGTYVAGGTAQAGKMNIATDVQGPEMGCKEGGYSFAQLYASTVTTGDSHTFWLRRDYIPASCTNQQLFHNNSSYSGTLPAAGLFVPDIKTAIHSGNYPTRTNCPTNYVGGCDTSGLYAPRFFDPTSELGEFGEAFEWPAANDDAYRVAA